MEGVPGIPLDVMLWLSVGVWSLGAFCLLPIWWRSWRVKRGAYLPITEGDITHQTITRWLLLLGTMSIASTLLLMASRALPFAAFMVLCVALGCAGIFSAWCIDVARARRH